MFLNRIFRQERFNWFLWFSASLIKNSATLRHSYWDRLRYWHMIKTTFLQKNVNNLETLRLFHFFLTSANKPQSSLVLYCKFEVNHDRRTRWKKKNSLLDLPSHSYGPFAIGDKEKNKTIVIFFFTFIPKWQNSRVNVMNVKNGCLEVLESVTLFLLKTETCDAKNCWEFLVDAAFCFVKIILVSEKRGQIQS